MNPYTALHSETAWPKNPFLTHENVLVSAAMAGQEIGLDGDVLLSEVFDHPKSFPSKNGRCDVREPWKEPCGRLDLKSNNLYISISYNLFIFESVPLRASLFAPVVAGP